TIMGRITNPLSAALSKILPEHFPARIEVRKIGNSGDYPKLIETGQIELAMIQTDLAYAAYTHGLGDSAQPMHKLRGMGVLYTTPLHLLATESSHVRNVMDLRGKRVFVGAVGSPTEFTAKASLQGLGLSLFEDMHIKRVGEADLARSLRSGELD